jgi:hypothetical protein
MTIDRRGTMPNGDTIQLENWVPTYPDLMNPHTVAVYMVSRYTLPGAFAPKAGQLFRCAFTFPTADAARTVYEALRTGAAQPADYVEFLYYPHHAPCVTGKGA